LYKILIGILGLFIETNSVVDKLTGVTIDLVTEDEIVTLPVKYGSPIILLPCVIGFVFDDMLKLMLVNGFTSE